MTAGNVVTSIPGVQYIAVNDTTLYGSVCGGTGSVQAWPLAGGSVSTVISSIQCPEGVAATATTVYVASYQNPGFVLAHSLVGAGDESLTNLNTPEGVATTSTMVVVSDQNDRKLLAWMFDAGTIAFDGSNVPVLQSVHYVNGVAADEQYAYFDDQSTNTVYRVPLEGGVPTTLAAHRPGTPVGLAVTATDIFWAEQPGGDAGYVMKLAK